MKAAPHLWVQRRTSGPDRTEAENGIAGAAADYLAALGRESHHRVGVRATVEILAFNLVASGPYDRSGATRPCVVRI
ncbi:hypothetical protein ACFU9X_37420 [Streptomyces atratus]|uniref:hypothetical protein n=1 Tax=Streptomyces atratus TaxID=1893 RepID=UPI003688C3D5